MPKEIPREIMEIFRKWCERSPPIYRGPYVKRWDGIVEVRFGSPLNSARFKEDSVEVLIRYIDDLSQVELVRGLINALRRHYSNFSIRIDCKSVELLGRKIGVSGMELEDRFDKTLKEMGFRNPPGLAGMYRMKDPISEYEYLICWELE